MILKKNKVSNLIWIIYSIFVMAFSALVFTKAFEGAGFDAGWGLVAVPVMLGVSVGIVILSEFLRKKQIKQFKIKPLAGKIIPYALALGLIVTGILLRIRAFSAGNFDLGVYYRNSEITQQPLVKTLHGASQFYYYFLRQLFMVFGNHFEAAVIYQIVCQIIAFAVMFFAVKRMMGNVPAITMLAFAMIAPYSVTQCMKLGPSSMFLLFVSVDVLLISYIVPFKKFSYILAAVVGAFTGLIGYMDLTSLVFIIISGVFLLVDENAWDNSKKIKEVSKKKDYKIVPKKKSNFFIKIIDKIKSIEFFKFDVEKVALLQDKTVALIIFFGAWIFILFICSIVDLAVTGYSFSYVVRTQIASYAPGDFSLYSIYSGVDIVSGIILAVLLIIGIPAGFRRKLTDQGNVVFLITLLIAVMSGFAMINRSMNCYYYILTALTVLGGEAIFDIAEPVDGLHIFVVADDNKQASVESDSDDKKNTVHKIEDGEMLANPLPVPEKKSRKKMEYDYFVPDDAEYDL
ncbi:MAG: glycosyltransferase family 39 protein [Lachnospiraceae bacterium]|nr:glycosyltransferase family 39 protein [Lachnospiraceae bacterium]